MSDSFNQSHGADILPMLGMFRTRPSNPKPVSPKEKHAAQVAALLRGTAAAEPWSARAAVLMFAQYFWFRHAFLLAPADYQSLKVRPPALALPVATRISLSYIYLLLSNVLQLAA